MKRVSGSAAEGESPTDPAASSDPDPTPATDPTSTSAPAPGPTETDDDNETPPAAPLTIPSDGYLTRRAFRAIYEAEVNAGKVWGVSWDLAACGHPLPPSDRTFQARYDRIFLQVRD
jgi:hypothetical protein